VEKHLSSGNIERFPLLLQTQDQSVRKEVISLIISHLELLTGSFDQYVPSTSSEKYELGRKHFVGFSQNSLSIQEEEQLTE
jgi:hypothetical protein